MNTTARQQLAELDLKQVYGITTPDADFNKNMLEMSQMFWSNFLNEEVPYLLPEDRSDELADLLAKEEATQDDFMDFFRSAIEDFDEVYRTYILDNKEQAVRGRIQELKNIAAGNAVTLEKLLEIERLVEIGEWIQVAEKLSMFSIEN